MKLTVTCKWCHSTSILVQTHYIWCPKVKAAKGKKK